jgi:hypothetical protein
MLDSSLLPYWYFFASVLAFNTLVFLFALLKNAMSVVDIIWSLMFLIPNGL